MNRKLRDRCQVCDRNGLTQEAGRVRRRCQFCFKEELRPCDRVLYTVCRATPDFVQGKGWFMDGWSPSHPTFKRQVAERAVAETVAKEAAAEGWHHTVKRPFPTEAVTIQGQSGTVVYTNGGPVFYFLGEQIVDVSEILQQE